jgi:hypothetical protein
MAEVVVGLVASSIAVGGLGRQIGKSIVAAVRIWNQLKDVPEEIQDLLEELELLEPLFADMADHLKQHDIPPEVWDDSSAKRSLEFAKKARKTLKKLVADIDEAINSSPRRFKRRVVSVKALMKEDTLKRLEKRLEKALSLLNSSMALFNT